jgi:hypothetical protein
MLKTDLNGLINEMQQNKYCHLILLILICILVYWLVSTYIISPKIKFADLPPHIVYGLNTNSCKGDIPKIDEVIIRNMIELPNRNPKLLTSSMVYPEIRDSEEERRKTRMDVLNMFYNSFDDDLTSFKKRPQGLYLTP